MNIGGWGIALKAASLAAMLAAAMPGYVETGALLADTPRGTWTIHRGQLLPQPALVGRFHGFADRHRKCSKPILRRGRDCAVLDQFPRKGSLACRCNPMSRQIRTNEIMSYAENPYRVPMFSIAAEAEEDERADFIRKTYLHLAGAVFAFAGMEAVLLNVPGLSERYMALSRCVSLRLAGRDRRVYGRLLPGRTTGPARHVRLARNISGWDCMLLPRRSSSCRFYMSPQFRSTDHSHGRGGDRRGIFAV